MEWLSGEIYCPPSFCQNQSTQDQQLVPFAEEVAMWRNWAKKLDFCQLSDQKTFALEAVRTVPTNCSSSCRRDKGAKERRQYRGKGGDGQRWIQTTTLAHWWKCLFAFHCINQKLHNQNVNLFLNKYTHSCRSMTVTRLLITHCN